MLKNCVNKLAHKTQTAVQDSAGEIVVENILAKCWLIFSRPLQCNVRLLSRDVVCNTRALWPNGWTDQDETWHACWSRPWPHYVIDGNPAPPPPKGHSPLQFLAHICCGQMAAWIKMSLGMEQGLGPGDCVRWGPSAPSPKGGRSPQIFGPCLLWPNGCMDQDASWYADRP